MRHLFGLLFLLPTFFLPAQKAVFHDSPQAWVDSSFQAMDWERRLGQLFMVAAYSNKGEVHKAQIQKLIAEQHIGGLIFFQGTPSEQARLTNLYQQNARMPLMIAMDAEWGLAMRLKETFKFPWPLTVGAIVDTQWAYDYGKAIAQHCKALGVHINFAPVVDVNTNPKNPIIGARSFGENPQRVRDISLAFMRGMQDQGVMAVAKHYPGHGDTESDSHKTLPTVAHDMERLEQVELFPYQSLFEAGLGGVMVAHLNVPAMDPSGTPASLSKSVLNHLTEEKGFEGLIFTDALNMRGVADLFPPGKVDLEALKAGNDVLLFAEDVPRAISEIKLALKDGSLDTAWVETRIKKILAAKYWLGLNQKTRVEPSVLDAKLHRTEDRILNRRIFEKATTLLVNRDKTLPIKDLRGLKIASLSMGTDISPVFSNTLKKYTQVDHFEYRSGQEESIMQALADYDQVIVSVYSSNASPWKSYKVAEEHKRFIRRIALQNKMIITIFSNPYSLRDFPEAQKAQALLMAYQNHPDAEEAAAQIIFGALPALGRLPVSPGAPFEAGFGLNTSAIGRMGFALPEEVGMNSSTLAGVDALVQSAIAQRATPGAQVLIARKGKIFYHKSFGKHTYEAGAQEVRFDDVYDLASITKIAVSVPLLMRLVEEGKLNLDQTLGHYLPELEGSNKADLVLREILAHQARLKPWIPFYLETLENGSYKKGVYQKTRSFNFPHQVVEGLYANRYWEDTIYQRIIESPINATKGYKYSDIGYYLFKKVIERIEGRPIEELVHENLYQSLGATSMTYHPLDIYPLERIVPTEDDKTFRKTLIHGYVHDQGAAMLGGVAGHAGLFGSAHDLAKLMQMYLQKGSYAGVEYFDSITVNEFIRCQYCSDDNRRGIGFDKPQLEGPGPTCGCVSPESFGHTGFTGTLAWADPEEEIVYIFLSNRIHPSAENRKLLSLSTRTKIQEVIYDAIEKEQPFDRLIGQR